MNPLNVFKKKKVEEASPAPAPNWGPFELPARAAWMRRAANLHNWEKAEGGLSLERDIAEEDFLLLYRWILEASAEKDPIERVKKALDIIDLWPIARKFGRFFLRS